MSSSTGRATANSSSRPSWAYFCIKARLRRKRSTARRFPTVVSQAPGLRGVPSRWPLPQCVEQRVLRQVLGQSDVAHECRQGGDDPRELHPEDGLDGGGCIGGGHATDSTTRS